jgi:glutamate--cysteine ligase
VLDTMTADFGASYTAFIRAQSEQTRAHFMALPWTPSQQAAFEAQSLESVHKRLALEAADTVDFETYRQAYLAPERLRV